MVCNITARSTDSFPSGAVSVGFDSCEGSTWPGSWAVSDIFSNSVGDVYRQLLPLRVLQVGVSVWDPTILFPWDQHTGHFVWSCGVSAIKGK